MAALNKCMFIGNLTRDPELKYTPQGTAVCKFGLAVGRKFKGADGQMQEQTTFINIVAFGKTGEACDQYLAKGRPVFVEGRLEIRDYETQDGQKRKATEVIADAVQFLGSGKAAADNGGDAKPQGQTEHGAAKANGYHNDNGGFDDIPF